MVLTLYGRANQLTRRHFLDAGEHLGLRPRATTRMIDSIVDAARDWPDRCGDIGFDDRQTGLLADMLHTRIGSLTGNWPVRVSTNREIAATQTNRE